MLPLTFGKCVVLFPALVRLAEIVWQIQRVASKILVGALTVEVGIVMFAVPSSILETLGQLFFIHVLLDVSHPEPFGGSIGNGRFVKARLFVECNTETRDAVRGVCATHSYSLLFDKMCDHSGNDRRVNTTTEVDSNGNIGSET
ncbi:asparagine synthase, partial [Aureobasidium melanogenum]